MLLMLVGFCFYVLIFCAPCQVGNSKRKAYERIDNLLLLLLPLLLLLLRLRLLLLLPILFLLLLLLFLPLLLLRLLLPLLLQLLFPSPSPSPSRFFFFSFSFTFLQFSVGPLRARLMKQSHRLKKDVGNSSRAWDYDHTALTADS